MHFAEQYRIEGEVGYLIFDEKSISS